MQKMNVSRNGEGFRPVLRRRFVCTSLDRRAILVCPRTRLGTLILPLQNDLVNGPQLRIFGSPPKRFELEYYNVQTFVVMEKPVITRCQCWLVFLIVGVAAAWGEAAPYHQTDFPPDEFKSRWEVVFNK